MDKNKILIIADDLTGSVDTSACFTHYGASNVVSLSAESVIIGNEDVHAINASTREKSLDLAKELHFRLSALPGIQDRIIIKKTDMGFRGNHGGEMEGLLEGLGYQFCYVLNAIPDHNAFVLNGEQYVKGKILTESMYAQDPSHKPTTSNVSEILGRQTNLKIGSISLDDLRSGNLAQAIAQKHAEGCRILIFDVITEEDCDAIVRTTLGLEYSAVWAGTLGLMEAMGRCVFPDGKQSVLTESDPPSCLCFSGSNYSTVLRQIRRALESNLVQVTLDMDVCITDPQGEDAQTEIQRALSLCRKANQQGNVLLNMSLSPENRRPGIGPVLLETLTSCAETLCTDCTYRRLVVIGGETTAAILRALEVQSIEILACPETGVALGRLRDGRLSGLSFACKGGSVGTDDALRKMLYCSVEA